VCPLSYTEEKRKKKKEKKGRAPGPLEYTTPSKVLMPSQNRLNRKGLQNTRKEKRPGGGDQKKSLEVPGGRVKKEKKIAGP